MEGLGKASENVPRIVLRGISWVFVWEGGSRIYGEHLQKFLGLRLVVC